MSATRNVAVPVTAGWMALAIAFTALGLPACGGEGSPLSPVATLKESEPPPAPTQTAGTGGGTPAPPPRKREVLSRNPFGGPPSNLFADGDFELSTLPAGHTAQVGWRAFSPSGGVELSIASETGGICRTGLRCAVLQSNMILFVRGAAAPKGAGHVASIWSRPPPDLECHDVAKLVLVECDTFDALVQMKPRHAVPDASGWCEHRASVLPQESSVCLYVESSLRDGQTALLDSATLLPDDGSAGTISEAWAPPREVVERMRDLGERLRRGRRFGKPLGFSDEGFPLPPGTRPRPTLE